MEVGDLPGRKCQPHQAVIGLFRHYGGGQTGGQNEPSSMPDQKMQLGRSDWGFRLSREKLYGGSLVHHPSNGPGKGTSIASWICAAAKIVCNTFGGRAVA